MNLTKTRVLVAALTEEDKLMLALHLLDHEINVSLSNGTLVKVMAETDSLPGSDGWLNHMLRYLAIGSDTELVWE